MGKEAIVVAVTEERVKELIAEALKGVALKEDLQVLITGAELEEKLNGLATMAFVEMRSADQVKAVRDVVAEELDRVLDTAIPATLKDSSVLDLAAKPPLDPVYLEGLTFKDASLERVVVDGRPRMVPTPIERELRPEDVLDYRVDGDRIHIATKDGKKHTVDL